MGLVGLNLNLVQLTDLMVVFPCRLNNAQAVSETSASLSCSGTWVQNCRETALGVIRQQREKTINQRNISPTSQNQNHLHGLGREPVMANLILKYLPRLKEFLKYASGFILPSSSLACRLSVASLLSSTLLRQNSPLY